MIWLGVIMTPVSYTHLFCPARGRLGAVQGGRRRRPGPGLTRRKDENARERPEQLSPPRAFPRLEEEFYEKESCKRKK